MMNKNGGRESLHKELEKRDISPSGYIYELPLHKQPVLSEHSEIELPKTEFMCANNICLPIFYEMSDEQALFVSNCVRKIMEK